MLLIGIDYKIVITILMVLKMYITYQPTIKFYLNIYETIKLNQIFDNKKNRKI